MTDEEVKHLKFDFSWITLMSTLGKQYADFTHPSTQYDTLQSRWMRNLRCYSHDTVPSRVSGMPLMFASSLRYDTRIDLTIWNKTHQNENP